MQRFMMAAAALFLGACSAHLQTTSGADYLSRYDAQAAAAHRIGGAAVAGKGTLGLDPAIRAAAEVEPILRFPARIGLARIEDGRLTTLPQDEGELWQALAKRHGSLGTFVPVDPLVAHFTARAVGLDLPEWWRQDVGHIVETIRLGAARQHLDAVLIYEVGARASNDTNLLAIAELTIIGGAILPTRSLEAEGLARALLLDVRNGYPYGSATSSTDLSELAPAWGSDARMADLRDEALLKVTGSLIPEVETMFRDLVTEMNGRVVRK